MPAPDVSALTDRELIADLDRVERAIRSTTTYVSDGSAAGRVVSPELLALAEREEEVTAELRRRRTAPLDVSIPRPLEPTAQPHPSVPVV